MSHATFLASLLGIAAHMPSGGDTSSGTGWNRPSGRKRRRKLKGLRAGSKIAKAAALGRIGKCHF